MNPPGAGLGVDLTEFSWRHDGASQLGELADNRNPARNFRLRHGGTMLISAAAVKTRLRAAQ
jgi:hypothetical protein